LCEVRFSSEKENQNNRTGIVGFIRTMRYFIPNKTGVSWSPGFIEDLKNQGWKAKILSDTGESYNIKRIDGFDDHWYVRKAWGVVVDEAVVDLPDKMFEL
jgi:hypothetical protein